MPCKPAENVMNTWLRYAGIVVAGWIVFLCLTGYLFQRSLWNDEIAVLESVVEFNTARMFSEPLKAVQVFPRVYLFIIQKISAPFDYSLLSLRLMSFLAMLTGLAVWLRIARYEFRCNLQYFLFILSWCASVPLLYYSAELKPYSMDVLAASLFILFIYNQRRLEQESRKVYVTLLVLLPLLGFFSYPAFLFFIFPLYNLFVSVREERSKWPLLAIYLITVAVVAGVAYTFDMRLRPVKIVTEGFGDYFVWTDSLQNFVKTSVEGIRNLFGRYFVERPRAFKRLALVFTLFGLGYIVVGFFKNFKKAKRIDTLTLIAFVVFAELFLLGVLKKYPFTVPRTSLFFAPIVLWATIKGIEALKTRSLLAYRVVLGLYGAYILFIAVCISRMTLLGNLRFLTPLW